jgi:malonyl-CoA decarboxylase
MDNEKVSADGPAVGHGPALKNRSSFGKLAEFLGLSQRQEEPSPEKATRKVITLCHGLLSTRGEVSGSRLASEALAAYQTLEGPARDEFFDLLAKEFSPDPEEVGRAGDAYRKQPSPENLAWLQRVVEPPRQELFRRLNMARDGTSVLVDIRSQLLEGAGRNPQWEPIAADLEHLLTSWFNRGFLVLQRIDWRTSATILEKLIKYEAVHQIQGWDDLRRRLEADRRCYGFFHPALPDEPIIFIEVALTRGMSESVQPLLDPDSSVLNPKSADCAMFYSITNCQEGLRGVPFGSFLIKQVVEDLGKEFPRLRRFATVSPVPGFREWLTRNMHIVERDAQRSALPGMLARLEDPKWFDDKELSAELQKHLVPLCANYLLHAKQGKEPYDSVARFHLRNGARLERINWLGDTSATGMQRSAGLMTNYVYRLTDVERNHELYTREYRIAASHEIAALAKQAEPSSRRPVGDREVGKRQP